MKPVLYILLAVALTFVSSYSFGFLLIRGLRIRLYRSEERFFSFVTGSALLSTLVFLIAAAGLARKGVFIAATLPFAVMALWLRRRQPEPEGLPEAPIAWRLIFWGGFICFTYIYLANAMLPETSADGVSYHLALVARYLREHRFPRITNNMYASLSQGAEMLFLYAFSIGRHTAAAMVEFLFLLALPFGMLSYARRIGYPRAGVIAALLAYASPVFGRAGTIAYVDVSAAVVAFALFYTLQIWRERPSTPVTVMVGLLAGFGYAIKYPSFVGVPYALALIGFFLAHRPRMALRHAALAGLCALAVMSPWLIKNAVFVSNPFAPFLNRWFPNPYVYASFEKQYIEMFRHMNGVTWAEIPIEVTIRGDRLTGLIGPVFLLAPLALLGLRRREIRQLLLAAAVCFIPYFNNIGTRFLIPSVPFLALAMALTVDRFRGMGPIVLGAHLFLSWPSVIPYYAGQYVWRVDDRTDWPAALRRTPEHDYLKKALAEYEIGVLLDREVPTDQPVFSPSVGGRSYHRHDVFIGYESAFGNRIQDMLYRAADRELRPTLRHTHLFVPVEARRVRFIQVRPDPSPVEIAEVRIFRGDSEIPRSFQWRLRASENPWDVQDAFDNSPVTVWKPNETTTNTFIEIDFGSAVAIDRLTADIRVSQTWSASRVDIDSGDGHWRTVSGEAKMDQTLWPPRMRRAAAEEMKANGIHWILIRDDDLLAGDLADRAHQWGIREMGASNGYRLWHVD